MTEWTIGAVAVDRSVNDTRSERGDLFRPKPEFTDRARTIPLREDVGSLYELLQTRRILALGKIEEAAALAVARIEDMLGNLGQMLAPPPSSTSAPCSASVRAAIGPARMRVRSNARMPLSGRPSRGSSSGSLSPILKISTIGLAAQHLAMSVRSHSSFERTMPPHTRASSIAASRSSASHFATGAGDRLRV